MRLIYINLDQRKDKRLEVENLLNFLNIKDYERFPAERPSLDFICDWESNSYPDLSPRIKKDFKKELNFDCEDKLKVSKLKSQIGCYISHFKIHEKMLNNKEPYLIVEDDVFMNKFTIPSLYQIIDNLNDSTQNNWDIIRSCIQNRKLRSNKSVQKIVGVNKWAAKRKSASGEFNFYNGGSHFSAFRKANRIIDYLKSEYVDEIDALYSTDYINVYHSSMGVRTKEHLSRDLKELAEK